MHIHQIQMLGLYLGHHTVTALTYLGIIVYNGRLSALGCFGLIYEVLHHQSTSA